MIPIEPGGAALDPVAPVFALLTVDPRVLRSLDRSVLPPAVEVHPAPLSGELRVEVTARNPVPETTFVHAVRDGTARKEDQD